MNRLRQTAPHIREIVRKLQNAGYETYIVGGAVRDLLLGRTPKDYDISTAATPMEIRNVFGRRQARIIGKRFRLVHLHVGNEIIEISTFRRRPQSQGVVPGKLAGKLEQLPDHILFEDNDFGTAKEDAFRRDFTVNAMFYDPIVDNLIDFTGMGLEDINNQLVRIIGDGRERFEEDPVRLLRALKLVGQYGFNFEAETEKHLQECIPMIKHAANSRLTLELEKILASSYSDHIFAAFQRYGFLQYFLPELAARWNDVAVNRAMLMLNCRNRRVMAERYRNSVSVAVAAMALPFVAEAFGAVNEGELWSPAPENELVIYDVIHKIFAPHSIIKRVTASSCRMLSMQPYMFDCKLVNKFSAARSLSHARELLYIQNELWWHKSELIEVWERPKNTAKFAPADDESDNDETQTRRKPRRRYRKRSKDTTGGNGVESPAES